MSGLIDEWIRKADADYATACREMLADEGANFDAVCFHSQQCIEKLMKALLIKNGVTPPKTHDLFQLNLLLAPVCKKWSCRPEDLRYLTRASVDFRYPGHSATLREARTAMKHCRLIRLAVRRSLGLKT